MTTTSAGGVLLSAVLFAALGIQADRNRTEELHWQRELDKRLAELRAEGAPLHPNEFVRPKPDPRQDGAAVLRALVDELMEPVRIDGYVPSSARIQGITPQHEDWAEWKRGAAILSPYISRIERALELPHFDLTNDDDEFGLAAPDYGAVRNACNVLDEFVLFAPSDEKSARLVRVQKLLHRMADRAVGFGYMGHHVPGVIRASAVGGLLRTVGPEVDAQALEKQLGPTLEAASRRSVDLRWVDEELAWMLSLHRLWMTGASFGPRIDTEWIQINPFPAQLRRVELRDAVAMIDEARAVEPFDLDTAWERSQRTVESDEKLRLARSIVGYGRISLYAQLRQVACLRFAGAVLHVVARKQRTGRWPETLGSNTPRNPYTGEAFAYEVIDGEVRMWAPRPKYDSWKQLVDDELAWTSVRD